MSFGYTWFDGWPPEGDSIVESRETLLRFIDEIVERYPTPEGKIVIAGFSQGGMMSLDVGFRTTAERRRHRLHERRDLRSRTCRRCARLPVLIVHGTPDDMIPVFARAADAARARRERPRRRSITSFRWDIT